MALGVPLRPQVLNSVRHAEPTLKRYVAGTQHNRDEITCQCFMLSPRTDLARLTVTQVTRRQFLQLELLT